MGWMTGCCNGPDSDSTMQEILVRGLALGMRRGMARARAATLAC
jgi:hypothetical protein